MIILPESFIEIAAVAVTQHGGDFFHGKICALQQSYCPFHTLFQKNFRKGLADLPVQQRGNIIGMVGKMPGYIF